MRQINLRVSDELLARIDRARDQVPRERWLRRAVEQALGEQATSGENPVRRGVPVASGVPGPAPAEQPRGSSEQRSARLVVSEEIAGSSPAGTVRPFRQSVPGPNVEPVRSSSAAKRDVRPVPKGKS